VTIRLAITYSPPH